ncbi:transposase [Halomonas sp. TRM85114]|nr:transposase [Halomonas jincaotanensis]
MLRIYFLQQWYALTDEALEDATFEGQDMHSFIGVNANEGCPRKTPHPLFITTDCPVFIRALSLEQIQALVRRHSPWGCLSTSRN